MKRTRLIIEIALVAVIVVLGVMVYRTIVTPMRFEDECNRRRDAVVEKLKTIRTLQEAYKVTYNCYAGDLDSLVLKLKNGQTTMVKRDVLQKVPENMTEAEAIKQGYIKIDTLRVNALEKLRNEHKLDSTLTDEDLMNLKYIPGTNHKEQFECEAGTIERSGMQVSVFEVRVHLRTLLKDLDKQMVENKIAEIERNAEKYAGWKIGDMNNPITDGNFE